MQGCGARLPAGVDLCTVLEQKLDDLGILPDDGAVQWSPTQLALGVDVRTVPEQEPGHLTVPGPSGMVQRCPTRLPS